MNKLKLDLEDLVVESFSTGTESPATGTIMGRLLVPGDADSNAADCTQYCVTNGGGYGATCDARCYPSAKCPAGTGDYVTCNGFDGCVPTLAASCDDQTCNAIQCWKAETLMC